MTEELFYITISVASLAVIVLAAFGIVLACLVYSYQRVKLGKPDPDMVPSLDEAAHAELASLRNRVATLERLLTDDDRRVAGEIEKLRREEATPRASV